MQIVLKKMTAIHIIGTSVRTSNEETDQIAQQWEYFLDHDLLEKIPAQKYNGVIVAAYTEYESDYRGEYTMILGAPVADHTKPPEGMVLHIIPAGTYAVITAKGELPESVIQAWEYIWSADFPYERAYTSDFDWYDPVRITKEIPEIDIYIAVKE